MADPTTFDREFSFTVEAYNADKQISTFKTHKITVNYKYKVPYETVYIKAMPEKSDRGILAQLLQNSEIFKNQWLYRANDPYFGKAEHVRYQHAFGMKAAKLDDYVDAMLRNHYRKDIVLDCTGPGQQQQGDIRGGVQRDTGKDDQQCWQERKPCGTAW